MVTSGIIWGVRMGRWGLECQCFDGSDAMAYCEQP